MVGGSFENLCRICSGPGGHDISAPIPIYLHENPNEQTNWKKNISLLISEVIGLPVAKNDGLPQRICVICISYLKHASIFRQQAINNILSIKTAKLIEDNDNFSLKIKKSMKNINDDDYNNEDDFNINDNNNINTCSSINNFKRNLKKITNDGYKNNINNNNNNSKKLLSDESDTTEDDDEQITSSDNNKINDEEKEENVKQSITKNLINYNERNFEEDDITTLDIFKNNENIIFNVPEHFKERKCHTCRRCFMFKETYEEHINGCIELKFVQFINDVKQLLKLKRTKTLSSYEFIRRIIFAIKKGYGVITEYCNEFNINDDIQSDLAIADIKPKDIIKIKDYDIDDFCLFFNDNDKPLFNNISKLNDKSKTPNTITDNSVDEYDEYDNDEADIDNNDKTIKNINIIENHNNNNNVLIKKNVFMSSCKQCNINFNNLIDLENHNYKYHNNNNNKNKFFTNNNDIDVYDDDQMDGIVNIIDNNLFNLNQKNQSIIKTLADQQLQLIPEKHSIDKNLIKNDVKPNLSLNDINLNNNNCNISGLSISSSSSTTSSALSTANTAIFQINNQQQQQNTKKLNNSLANAFATVSTIKFSSQPTFFNQSNYNNNNNNKIKSHVIKTVKCMKCDKKFLTISHLDEHLNRVHKP